MAALHHLCEFLTQQQQVTHYTKFNLHILFVPLYFRCFIQFFLFGFEWNAGADSDDTESNLCNILNASSAVIVLMQRASWKIPHLQSALLNPISFPFFQFASVKLNAITSTVTRIFPCSLKGVCESMDYVILISGGVQEKNNPREWCLKGRTGRRGWEKIAVEGAHLFLLKKV